jgi:pyrroline-5-carboxylate reductase
VKPNTVPTILEDIREAVTPLHLILSIAMGISIKQLEQVWCISLNVNNKYI